MKAAAGGVVGELARARIALDERGQRLGELEERTALMMTSAETFSKHAHEVCRRARDGRKINTNKSSCAYSYSVFSFAPPQVMLKCKDKKWYQF